MDYKHELPLSVHPEATRNAKALNIRKRKSKNKNKKTEAVPVSVSFPIIIIIMQACSCLAPYHVVGHCPYFCQGRRRQAAHLKKLPCFVTRYHAIAISIGDLKVVHETAHARVSNHIYRCITTVLSLFIPIPLPLCAGQGSPSLPPPPKKKTIVINKNSLLLSRPPAQQPVPPLNSLENNYNTFNFSQGISYSGGGAVPADRASPLPNTCLGGIPPCPSGPPPTSSCPPARRDETPRLEKELDACSTCPAADASYAYGSSSTA